MAERGTLRSHLTHSPGSPRRGRGRPRAEEGSPPSFGAVPAARARQPLGEQPPGGVVRANVGGCWPSGVTSLGSWVLSSTRGPGSPTAGACAAARPAHAWGREAVGCRVRGTGRKRDGCRRLGCELCRGLSPVTAKSRHQHLPRSALSPLNSLLLGMAVSATVVCRDACHRGLRQAGESAFQSEQCPELECPTGTRLFWVSVNR